MFTAWPCWMFEAILGDGTRFLGDRNSLHILRLMRRAERRPVGWESVNTVTLIMLQPGVSGGMLAAEISIYRPVDVRW